MPNESLENSTTVSVYLGVYIGQLTVGSVVLLTNGILLLQMFFNREYLRWKYHALTCHMTFCDLCSGLFFAILAMSNIFGGKERHFFKWVKFYLLLSIRLTVINYNCSLYLQYVAIRDPFKFKTRITKLFVIKVLIVVWLIMLPYAMLNSIFVIFYPNSKAGFWFILIDGTVVSVCIILTLFHYYHVMKIAKIKKSQDVERRNQLKFDRSYSGSTGSTYSSGTVSMKRRTSVRIYRSLIATGFSLFMFLLSYCPCLISSLTLLSKNEYDKPHSLRKPIVTSSVFALFTRAIFDPLVFLFREPKLKKSFPCNRN